MAAKQAYDVADAMIAERERRKNKTAEEKQKEAV
jgi:hypothetical protein